MTISKFTKEEINSIKTSANRFDVNIITPNSDKNFKSIAYLNTEEGIEDLYNISKAEKFCSDNSLIANKKGVMTKNGEKYKKNLAKFDIGYLALTIGKERPNRTYQNAIRRLSDNPNYSKDKAIEMLSSEFGLNNCQKFIHPNTLITKLDLYLKSLSECIVVEDNTSEEDSTSEDVTSETSNDLDNKDFSKVYDAIELTLNKSNVTVDDVKSIMELSLTIIDKKIKANKVKLQASNG